jgi:hypothetical protein
VDAAKCVAAHTRTTSAAAGIFAALTGPEVAIPAAVVAVAARRNPISGVNGISDGTFASLGTKYIEVSRHSQLLATSR